jgi:hypothetical protein
MDDQLESLFGDLTRQAASYLPHLAAGLVLLVLGVAVGWIAKRIVVRLLVLLRIDRLVRRTRWGGALAKADVRYAFVNSLGNTAAAVVFLLFLNAALDALQLRVLSAIIEQSVLFVPRLVFALVILAAGWFLAGWTMSALQRTLLRENVPRATLVARCGKGVVLLFAFAMAITELDVARDVVVIGFTVMMVTFGVVTVVYALRYGARSIPPSDDPQKE